MKKILVLGAGRSSSAAIDYLLNNSVQYDWKITVADIDVKHASDRINNHQNGTAISFTIDDEDRASYIISEHDVVVSMLPPHLHDRVAAHCLTHSKHLVTASYVSKKMHELNDEATKKGILFMCEMGLDPGIDHMSAMQIIDEVKSKGGKISSFRSSCGGLVAPACDDNPWHYKISWNPRNVVLAGQATAQYLEHGIKKFKPYHRLFAEAEAIKIKGYGNFELYPNRDSLSYIDTYKLNGIETIIRATLRKDGYCSAWNALVQLGVTDDSYTIEVSDKMTYRDWLYGFLLPKKKDEDVVKTLARTLGIKKDDKIIERLKWLGISDNKKIGASTVTPAQILQSLMEEKWVMKKNDRDMVVMIHEFEYAIGKKNFLHTSTMVLEGEKQHTAMAKTVGLPLGIMVKLILTTDLKLKGVRIPVMKEVYEPTLKELKELGVVFNETIKQVKK